MSHPIPDSTRMANPNQVRGVKLSTGTLIDRFFLRVDTCTCFLIHMHNFCNNKNHLHIYKRTTTGVVSLKIYTHILSPIYLDMYIFFFNTTHQRSRKQCGEHLSLSWPALLMWDVLSSCLDFCFNTYTD